MFAVEMRIHKGRKGSFVVHVNSASEDSERASLQEIAEES